MSAMALDTVKRGRIDHVLPQGYLDGFSSPSKKGRLSVFDRDNQRWFEASTRRIGGIRGFYDYPPGSQPDQTADQAFARLEAQFPPVRRELVENSFSNWRVHLDFLLHFAQMLRTRSELFRQQDVAHSRKQTMFKVVEVLERKPSERQPGRFDETLSVRPFRPVDQREYETLLRNKAITDMRTEIAKGAAWLSERHWCLRFAVNPTDPVITTDHPVVVDGRSPTLEEALPDPNTLVFFPVCWQACLIGSMAKFDKETDAFHSDDLIRLRGIQLKLAQRFVFSPSRVAFGLAAVNAAPF